MELFTTRTKIRGVAAAWRGQYGRRKEEIALQLDALDGETATADDVARIIGNRSWTDVHCNECEREVESVVMLGEEPDYESSTAYVCADCLRKALALIAPSPGAAPAGKE